MLCLLPQTRSKSFVHAHCRLSDGAKLELRSASVPLFTLGLANASTVVRVNMQNIPQSVSFLCQGPKNWAQLNFHI